MNGTYDSADEESQQNTQARTVLVARHEAAGEPNALNALLATQHLIVRLREVSRNKFFGILAFMALGAIFDSAGLLLLLPILSILVAPPGQNAISNRLEAIGLNDTSWQLGALLVCFVIVGLLRAQVAHSRDTSAAAFQADFAMKERADIMGRIAQTRWADISTLGHARVANAVISEIDRASSAVQLLLRICVTFLTLLSLFAMAFYLSAELATFAFGLTLLGGLFVWNDWRHAVDLGKGARKAIQAMHATTANFMSGLKTAMSESSQSLLLFQANKIIEQGRANSVKQQQTQSGTRRLYTSANTLFAAALVGGGVMLEISTTTLIAVIVVIARMAAPILQLQQTIQSYLFVLPSFEEVRSLRNKLGTLHPAVAFYDMTILCPGPIVFDQAVYRHQSNGGVGPISLAIQQGQTIGIEGPSGAGKTTFLDLLTGLIKPQSGAVAVGTTVIYGRQGAAWRRNLAYQSQSIFQINNTVKENLLLSGVNYLVEADMWWALELTCMDTIVRRLPGGLHEQMGEVGATLSGGERQRIALARGLLRKPALLILDEALAAVDIPTEHRILTNIRKAMPDLTIVIVAHRPESLALCDRRLVFDQGFVSETSKTSPTT